MKGLTETLKEEKSIPHNFCLKSKFIKEVR